MLATVGLALSAYLELIHVQSYLAPSAENVCRVGETFDCNQVAMSKFAVILGVPLPVWGAAGFLAMGAAAFRRSKVLLPLAGFSTVASVVLLVIELASIGAICMFCEGVHAVALLLFLYALWKRNGLKSPTRQDLIEILAVPAALVVAAWIFAPRYWALTAWQDGVPHPTGVDENERPWVGATEPTVVVYEYTDYGCMHCAIGTARMRQRLSRDADEIRVVRVQQPRQHCRPSMKSCAHVRAALCAGEQGKFWEMDSWLFLNAPGNRGLDHKEGAAQLQLDLDAFEACLEREDVYDRAEADFKDARKNKIRATPGYIVDGKRLQPKELYPLLDELL